MARRAVFSSQQGFKRVPMSSAEAMSAKTVHGAQTAANPLADGLCMHILRLEIQKGQKLLHSDVWAHLLLEGLLPFQLARTELTYHNAPLHPGTPDAAPEECHHQCFACTRPAADPGHFPAGTPQLPGHCAASLAFLQPQNVAHVPVHVRQASDAVSESRRCEISQIRAGDRC